MTEAARESNLVRFGMFEMNLETGELRRGGVPVRLQPQPFKVLAILVGRPDQLVTREELRQHVWAGATYVDFDQGLNFCIKQIRLVLGDTADNPTYIETLPRRGYRFIARIEDAERVAPHPVVAARTIGAGSWPRSGVLAGGAVVIGVLAGLTGWVLATRPSAPLAESIRFTVLAPVNETFSAYSTPAISPDGRRLVFASVDETGVTSLWLRSLDSPTGKRLPGTAGAVFPFWAPDSRRIGFFADGKLKTMDVLEGDPRTVCQVPDGRGGAWNADDLIVFAPNADGLFAVRVGGGAARRLTTLDRSRQEMAHRWPAFLPDGRRFLFLVRSHAGEHTGVFAGLLDSPRRTRVLGVTSNATFVAPRMLVYVQEPPEVRSPLSSAWRSAIVSGGTLVAQPFNPARLTESGPAAVLAEHVRLHSSLDFDVAAFSVSSTGVMAYRTADSFPHTRLVWLNRSGDEVGRLADRTFYPHPEIAPDGSKVALCVRDPRTGSPDIWVYDLVHGTQTRLTFDPAVDALPVWSPDSRRVMFASDRMGPSDLYAKEVSGANPEVLIAASPFAKFPTSWSPDGRYVLYQQFTASNDVDLYAVSTTGDGQPLPVAANEYRESQAQFSPDGRWVAYNSRATGRDEVYVQSFPSPGSVWQVSTNGGVGARWRGDGRELYYLSPDAEGEGLARLFAVEVDGSSSAFTFRVPRLLFKTKIWRGPPTPRNYYAVTRDGQRFLVDTLVERATPAPITVVLNWNSAIRRPRRPRAAAAQGLGVGVRS